MTIDLTALLAQAESAVARQAKAAREAAEKREAADLADDQRRAVRAVSEILEIPTTQDGWHRLELPAELATHASRTVWHATDDDEIRLAFRHRGITAGGDVLTVLALAPETGEWIAASGELTGLASLPATVENARRQADRWDADVADEEADPDHPDAARTEPAVRIAGDTIGDVLEAAIRLAVDRD